MAQALCQSRAVLPPQEAINNLFMTFNKTQTSPHWHLIKERGHPENEGRRDAGEALILSDWEHEGSPGKQAEAASQVQGRAGGNKEARSRRHRDQTLEAHLP